MSEPLDIAISGGGPGGFAAAIGLVASGHRVTVFEQAPSLARVGADVNLTPNVVHALDGLGVGERLRATAARPSYRISRVWDTGDETSRLPMSSAAEESYGAPQLTIHRGDLIAALVAKLPDGVVQLASTVIDIDPDRDRPSITLADGTFADADVVIAADGIHSVIRNQVFGPDEPRYTGLVSYRSVIDASDVEGVENLDAFTKWWGPTTDQQVVVFPLSLGNEIFVFATARDDDWASESWTTPGDIDELRARHSDWHPDVVSLMDACDATLKSALHVREPMEQWSRGHVTLLGDAAHPMTPFMAQGAGMAIEDAVVLSRALDGVEADAVPDALKAYEAARLDRTAQVQRQSLANDWLRGQGNADWLYGYDAWHTPV